MGAQHPQNYCWEKGLWGRCQKNQDGGHNHPVKADYQSFNGTDVIAILIFFFNPTHRHPAYKQQEEECSPFLASDSYSINATLVQLLLLTAITQDGCYINCYFAAGILKFAGRFQGLHELRREKIASLYSLSSTWNLAEKESVGFTRLWKGSMAPQSFSGSQPHKVWESLLYIFEANLSFWTKTDLAVDNQVF